MLANHLYRPAQLVLLERSARASDFNLRLEPNFDIIDIILRPLTYMYASTLFVKCIIAVKPKDERALNQNLRAHASPSVAISTALTKAASLFIDSWYSNSGSESATTPPPACRWILPPVITAVLSVKAISIAPEALR